MVRSVSRVLVVVWDCGSDFRGVGRRVVRRSVRAWRRVVVQGFSADIVDAVEMHWDPSVVSFLLDVPMECIERLEAITGGNNRQGNDNNMSFCSARVHLGISSHSIIILWILPLKFEIYRHFPL